jgi:membrane-bound lytic murein transglycosylase D
MEWEELVIKNPPPQTVWEVMRKGFALPDVNNTRVANERAWYLNHPAYVKRVANRASPYLYYIVSEVKKRGMPLDFALLPVVESAYDPFAYSNGRAAGLWQFIPGTGRRFDLRQDWWYDGRRDVAESTRAALDYLQYLHKEFHGDWLLALAAYNSGEGTVQRAIRRNLRHNRPTDFWHLGLPRETRAYVPRLLAVRDLFQDPGKYDIQLPKIPNKAYLARVDCGSQIDLALAAKLAGISLRQMYLLNPGYNRWATEPGGSHELFVPSAEKDGFLEKLQKLPASARVTWIRHKIRPGESLGVIARHYRTTIAVLRRTNHLRGNLIRAGHYLMVPAAKGTRSDYALSASQRLKHKQNIARGNIKLVHIVRSGDSFWKIARHYHVSVARVASWNGMAPADPLRVGQKLVIWKHSGSRVASLEQVSATPAAMLRRITYVVRSGDSLSSISNRFRVSVSDLVNWNGLSKDDYLQPGQHLRLYVDVREQSTRS